MSLLLGLLWAVGASAAELDAFSGEWGLDPVRSDDPGAMLRGLARAPVVQGSAASRYSPDQGAEVNEEERERAVRTVQDMLSISSRVGLVVSDGAVQLTFGGEAPVDLELGRKWQKVQRVDGSRYKIRVLQNDDHLVVERRIKSNVLTETFLPPDEAVVEQLFVVVRLDATGLASGLEFRRAYTALHDVAATH